MGGKLPALTGLCSLLLERSMRGGHTAVIGVNLGVAIEQVYNALDVDSAKALAPGGAVLSQVSACYTI